MDAFKNKLSMSLVKIIAFHLAKQIDLLILSNTENDDSECLSPFNEDKFCQRISNKLEALELKQRAEFIADEIHQVLPSDLTLRYQIIRGMLHTRPHANLKVSQQSDENGLCGWAMMCIGPIVAKHGLADFEKSLCLLKDMTAYFSCEFDVRPFIIKDQIKALSIMSDWVNHPDYHVRRLLSEGTRPKLPWAMQIPELIIDPSPMIPLLSALKDDKEEYVRRSVANHLNDIAKDHPELVADIAHEWINEGGVTESTQKNREKLVKHACRTLIKQGHTRALEAFGIHKPNVHLADLVILNKRLRIGDSLNFEITLSSLSSKPQKLIIDYLIHHKKANGQLTPKVFKWKSITLASNQLQTFDKAHSFKVITTRKYHVGEHAISIRINGDDYGYQEFELLAN